MRPVTVVMSVQTGVPGRDAEADVAAGALDGEAAPAGHADLEVAAAGGERDVVGALADLDVAGAGLDGQAARDRVDVDVAAAGGDGQRRRRRGRPGRRRSRS